MTLLAATRRTLLSPNLPWWRASSPLSNSLVGYWKLDEASGNALDSLGSNTLTDTNTVTSATGLVYSTARSFASASSEYLNIADNAALSTGDIDFWFSGWFYLNSSPNTSGYDILGKWDVASNSEYFLELYTATSQVHFRWGVSSNGTSATGDLDNIETVANTTWHFFACWHDSVANQTGYRLNSQTRTLSYSAGVRDGTSAFTIGRAITTRYFDGRIGPVMMGKGYIPTSDELDFLYNNGLGRP